MADLSERVARVEEQSDAHIRTMDYLRKDMSDLRHSMEALSAELRSEMGALGTALRGEMEALGTALRGEMEALSAALRGEMATLSTELRGEMGALRAEMTGLKTELRREMHDLKTELRGDMAALERRFDRMDARFNWVIGIVVTSSVATVGASRARSGDWYSPYAEPLGQIAPDFAPELSGVADNPLAFLRGLFCYLGCAEKS